MSIVSTEGNPIIMSIVITKGKPVMQAVQGKPLRFDT
jgi:hypothetical protein